MVRNSHLRAMEMTGYMADAVRLVLSAVVEATSTDHQYTIIISTLHGAVHYIHIIVEVQRISSAFNMKPDVANKIKYLVCAQNMSRKLLR